MIRRFNYTQRKRIDKSRIQIELFESDDDSPTTFSAYINLGDMGLPQDALIAVIAYRGQVAMRFDWGTVANSMHPPDTELTQISSNPSFRVMALAPDGSGRLLALADRIKPKRNNSPDSLLWLQEADLGKEVWRINYGDGNPTMLVNKNIPGISVAAREDAAFRSLVIPEALRSILTRAIIVDDCDPDDADGDWSDWMGFVQSFYSEEFPTSSDDSNDAEKADWIEGAVEVFAEQRFRASDQYATTKV